MKKWDREKVIREIRILSKNNPNFSPAQIFYKRRDLYQAGVRIFGSWRKALKAAGFEKGLKRPHRWDKDKVLEKIKVLGKKGVNLSLKNITKNSRALSEAARRYWGSWAKAVKKAGFNYNRIKWESVTGRYLTHKK